MEKIITYETLRRFAYSNDKLIKGKIRGIVVEFRGLNNTTINDKDPGDSLEYAEQGIIHVIPYNNPWCWMNARAVRYTDEIIEVLCDHYDLGTDVKTVSTGNSMGGLCCLTYCAYARITPVACVANCPVCDLPYHYTEREDLPRTLYSAFADYDGSLDDALRSASPLHLAEQGRMPDIPYLVFHCEGDKSVNIDMHSVKFVDIMKKTRNIELVRIPHRGHCDLSAEARVVFRNAIVNFIG